MRHFGRRTKGFSIDLLYLPALILLGIALYSREES